MKKAISLILVLALVFCLAACGGSKPAEAPKAEEPKAEEPKAEAPKAEEPKAEEPKAEEPKAEPVNLTFWYWADNTDQSACLNEAVKAFNETNGKGITVTAEEYPWGSGQFINDEFTAVMGGGGPDISTFKVSGGKLYAANSLLADMTSYVDGWADKGQISDAAWDIMKAATDDGTISMLPWTLEPLYVYYRPSMFQAAGIEVPTTIDEFLTACEKLTMDGHYGYGLRGANGGHEHLGNFLYAYGASWDDLTTPEAVEAYKAYLSIYQNGWAPESASTAAFAELTDMFKSGTAAMIIHHIGSSNQWLELFGDDVDAFVFPGSDKGQWTCTGDTEFAIMANCKNPDAAFEFYKFMTTGEGGTIWFKGTGKGLGTDNVTSTEEFKSNRFQAVSAEAMAVAGVLPPTETLSEFTGSVWTPTNQAALLGQMTPEDALKTMNDALHGMD